PEAVLFLVARGLPVLPEPGARRALLRADSVRVSGIVGDRGAPDRRDDLRDGARHGGALRAAAPGPARSLRLVRARRRRPRRAASLEGAVSERAVLPDPGGDLLRRLVADRVPLLPRLARPGRDGGSTRLAASA